jgi:MFS family permease
MPTSKLLPDERHAALSLAGIFALRMFGLFMIYPVFAVYAKNLPDATPARIGLALGIYGLAQALFQMPLGLLSDRVGRKAVIAGGLLVFAVGSVVAATAHSVGGIALGRFLQGMGAVGSAVLALAADLTSEEHRTKAMALIGMTIGLAFAAALAAGPAINGWIGVPGMFWLTAVLAGAALLLLYTAVPRPAASDVHVESEAVPALLGRVLRDPVLLRLDFGILAQHAILTAMFLGVPLVLKDAGIGANREWQLYLPALVMSVVFMVPLIIQAERHGRMRPIMLGSIAAISLAQAGFMLHTGSWWLPAVALALFFTAFNFLEAALPSLTSRLAPRQAKGAAMGVYSSSQFLGIFLGGALGGWCQGQFGLSGGFGFSLAVAFLWFMTSWNVGPPAANRKSGATPL